MPRFSRFSLPVLGLTLCLALAPFAAPAAAPAGSGPVSAIAALQKAIDTRDTNLMDRHMDLDAVIGKAADAVLNDTEAVRLAEESSPAVALMLASLGSDARTRAVARQLLASETRQFVRYGVSSGAFAGELKKGPHAGAGLLASLLRGGAKDKKSFGPATVRKDTGNEAVVATSLADASGRRAYPLELALRRAGGVWKVTEITNIQTLIRLVATDADKGDKAGGRR